MIPNQYVPPPELVPVIEVDPTIEQKLKVKREKKREYDQRRRSKLAQVDHHPSARLRRSSTAGDSTVKSRSGFPWFNRNKDSSQRRRRGSAETSASMELPYHHRHHLYYDHNDRPDHHDHDHDRHDRHDHHDHHDHDDHDDHDHHDHNGHHVNHDSHYHDHHHEFGHHGHHSHGNHSYGHHHHHHEFDYDYDHLGFYPTRTSASTPTLFPSTMQIDEFSLLSDSQLGSQVSAVSPSASLATDHPLSPNLSVFSYNPSIPVNAASPPVASPRSTRVHLNSNPKYNRRGMSSRKSSDATSGIEPWGYERNSSIDSRMGDVMSLDESKLEFSPTSSFSGRRSSTETYISSEFHLLRSNYQMGVDTPRLNTPASIPLVESSPHDSVLSSAATQDQMKSAPSTYSAPSAQSPMQSPMQTHSQLYQQAQSQSNSQSQPQSQAQSPVTTQQQSLPPPPRIRHMESTVSWSTGDDLHGDGQRVRSNSQFTQYSQPSGARSLMDFPLLPREGSLRKASASPDSPLRGGNPQSVHSHQDGQSIHSDSLHDSLSGFESQSGLSEPLQNETEFETPIESAFLSDYPSLDCPSEDGEKYEHEAYSSSSTYPSNPTDQPYTSQLTAQLQAQAAEEAQAPHSRSSEYQGNEHTVPVTNDLLDSAVSELFGFGIYEEDGPLEGV